MRQDTIYYIETDFGCTLDAAQNIGQARQTALRETGTHFFRFIRRATADDVAWIAAMGGRVPKGVIAKAPSK